MQRAALRLVLMTLPVLLLPACPRGGARAPEPAAADEAADEAALVLPVATAAQADAARDALTRLAARAQGGDLAAAWARIHYLADLFDDARFRRDDHSLALLFHGLFPDDPEIRPARGAEATDQVLAALLTEVDALLGRDRLHAHAVAARALLEQDSQPLESRAGLLSRMAGLKAVARGAGPLADNARLRLAGHCLRALSDAARARYAERAQVLAHCLYPLYDANPEPYFAASPRLRPPPPRWHDLVETLGALIQEVAASPGRLAAAGAHLRVELAHLAEIIAAHMPALPDPAALPRAHHAIPYDFTPLVILGSGADLGALDDIADLTRAVHGDGRRTLAVSLAADAPAALIVRVADAARQSGADRLELVTAIEQALRVPEGDYWAGRLQGDTLIRPAVVPLALAVLDGPARARTPAWDPDRASLGLQLEVSAASWRLSAPTGVIATFPAAEGSAEPGLRAALARLYAAFPEEDALVLVPGAGATVADLVRAAEAARHAADGRELLGRVGLARSAARIGKDELARRIARRAGARVSIEPPALAVRTPVVRRCYQERLEVRPGRGGRFRLELTGGQVTVVQGPRDRDLRACVIEGVAQMMTAETMAGAEIELAVE